MTESRQPQSVPAPRPAGRAEQLRRAPREEAFLTRLRELGVSAARSDELLAEWSIVGRGLGLDAAERGYWDAAADWLLLRIDG